MRFFTFLLIFTLLVFGVLFILTGWSYSDGERAGTVSKFSRRGYIFKTYEGVLNVGGFSGETGSLTPQYFDFSVKDDAVAQKVTEAIKTGQRVTLHYEEKMIRLPWNGDTKYYITDVEFLGGRPSGQQPFGMPQRERMESPAQPQAAPATEAPVQQVPADSIL